VAIIGYEPPKKGMTLVGRHSADEAYPQTAPPKTRNRYFLADEPENRETLMMPSIMLQRTSLESKYCSFLTSQNWDC
jgi:hypothetical protein